MGRPREKYRKADFFYICCLMICSLPQTKNDLRFRLFLGKYISLGTKNKKKIKNFSFTIFFLRSFSAHSAKLKKYITESG